MPAPGDYVLKLWLRDEAGNHDSRTAAAPLHLRFDDFAPDVAFEPLDPADPTLLKVRAADRGSGVAQAQVEIKSRKSDVWRPLPTVIEGSYLMARLDDERLRDGVYDLRARAADHAANERTSESRTDGQRAEVTMPIRLKTRLRVGLKRRGARRVRYRSRARVGYGRATRFRGRLTTRDRNPIQDGEVLVFSQARRAGAPMRLVATLKTSLATLPVAAALALHPRAAAPAVAVCLLLHLARYTRLAVVLLVVLTLGTLAGIRVDAAPPAAPALER